MKKPVAYLFLLAQLIPSTVFAGDYKMILGKGIEVCEAYLKNLNSFPKEPPMVCERKLNPSMPDLKRPAWQPLEAKQNFELVKEIDRVMHHVAKAEYEQYSEKYMHFLKKGVETGVIQLSVAELDVNQDGTPEKVLQYESADCNPSNEFDFAMPGGRTYLVLTDDFSGIDEQKTKWFTVGGRLGLFLFKGQVFIDHWDGDRGFKGGQLRALTPLSVVGLGTKVCKYSYSEQQRRSKP